MNYDTKMLLTDTHPPLLMSLIDALPEKVCVLDKDLKTVYFNTGFSELIEMAHGFTPRINEPIYDKTSKEDYEHWYPLMQNALLGIPHEEVTSGLVNGKIYHTKVSLIPLRYRSEVTGIMVQIQDVTRETLNQADLLAFRELASNLPNTDAFLCDRNLDILLAGGGEMKKYGADHVFFEGKNMIDIARALNVSDLIQYYDVALQGKPASYEYEYANEHYLLEVYPIFEGTEVKYIIILSRNITELKRITLKLQQINNTKDSILSIVAHDLRNPVTAILGVSDLIRTGNADLFSCLELINRSCSNALSIINDLLDITELGNDEFKLETELCELNDFIRETVETNSFNARDKQITIGFKTNRDDLFVQINRDKFKRVISNLLSNAVKFSHAKSKVVVHTELQDDNVLICVQDFGIGIPPSLQEIIFNKFTKAGRRGTAGEKSFGLGMSIVKQIVTLHQGEIWLESEENKGTAVYIRLSSAI